jgi:cytosine/adenosine deaminase-related metal-dependent hydrolase
MRKISADYIYTGSGTVLHNATLVVERDGTILDIRSGRDVEAEYYKGAICPGFVNVHTHLELSYAHQKISRGGGIDDFIHQLEQLKRSVPEKDKKSAVAMAMDEMYRSGTVLAGDIMNTDISLEAKSNAPLVSYNFIEVYGLQAEVAVESWKKALDLEMQTPAPKNIIPHAPYSLSRTLWQKIRDYQKPGTTLSMHYMESPGEADFFRDGSGPLARRFASWGLQLPNTVPTGKRPLESLKDFLHTADRLLLIHNTFVNEQDIYFAKALFDKLYFGLCPNANLFIENSLPPMDLLRKNKLKICIGTDSLASNAQLSVLEELKTLQERFDISTGELISWATKNGAEALGMEKLFGTIEAGKKPGLVHIKGIGADGKLLPEAVSKRIN